MVKVIKQGCISVKTNDTMKVFAYICTIIFIVQLVYIYNHYEYNTYICIYIICMFEVWVKHLSQHLSQLLARHSLRVGLGHSAIHGLQHAL